jgi:hypothetical protein
VLTVVVAWRAQAGERVITAAARILEVFMFLFKRREMEF